MLCEADFQYYQIIEVNCKIECRAQHTQHRCATLVKLYEQHRWRWFETKTQSCTEELDIFASVIFQSWREDVYSNARL